MSTRLNYWDGFWDYWEADNQRGEIVVLEWEKVIDWDGISDVAIGTSYLGTPSRNKLDPDFAGVYLEAGETYDFIVMGDHLLEIHILDMDGYYLESVDGDSVPGGLRSGANVSDGMSDAEFAQLFDWPHGDSIVDFTPEKSGWYTLTFNAYDTTLYNSEVKVAAMHEQEALPFLIDRDSFNWDNDIDTGDGYYVPAEDAQLYRAYMGAMGRIPDMGGFNWWANEIDSGREDLFSMADGFIHSSEFKGYADTNYNGYIDNHEFVTHMYEGVFGRSPDQGGYDYWMNELDSGASDQGEVLIYMTQSNEYIDQTLETVADYLFT